MFSCCQSCEGPIQSETMPVMKKPYEEPFRMKTGSSSCSSLEQDEDERANSLTLQNSSVVQSIDDFFNVMNLTSQKDAQLKVQSSRRRLSTFDRCVKLRGVIRNFESYQPDRGEKEKKRAEKSVRFLDPRKGFYVLPDEREDLREAVYSVNSSVNNPEWCADKSKNDYSITKARRESLS